MEVKTQIDVLITVKELLDQMGKAQAKGIKSVSYYIDNVGLNDLFKLYEYWIHSNHDVKLYFLGESFNAETIDVSYRVLPGYYINISSVKQKEVKPKINLINYN